MLILDKRIGRIKRILILKLIGRMGKRLLFEEKSCCVEIKFIEGLGLSKKKCNFANKLFVIYKSVKL